MEHAHREALHFVHRFSSMRTAAKKTWISFVAAAGLMITDTLLTPPAQAQTCNNGLLIYTIINTIGGYSCELGQLQFTFHIDLGELNNATNTSYLDFYDSPYLQEIRFLNTGPSGGVVFSYDVLSRYETIDSLGLTYEPALPTPVVAEIIPAVPAWPPSTTPRSISTAFVPNALATPPVFTSMTHKIYKSPGPLPLAGVGLALSFSRKLRRRARQATGSSKLPY
jgi:hypothetical protein